MPIYEYKCHDCGQISELLVLKKDEVVSCLSCNSQNLEKLMSAHNTMGSGGNLVHTDLVVAVAVPTPAVTRVVVAPGKNQSGPQQCNVSIR